MLYTIEYQIGTYVGRKNVNASSDEEAIAKAKRWVWKQNPPAPAYEHYEVISRTEVF